MKLSKQHFELIAETISNLPYTRVTGLSEYAVSRNDLAREFADMCSATNPNFDRERFLNACLTENYRAPRNVSRYERRTV